MPARNSTGSLKQKRPNTLCLKSGPGQVERFATAEATYLLHIVCRLGRGFQEDQAMLLCKLLALLCCDSAPVLHCMRQSQPCISPKKYVWLLEAVGSDEVISLSEKGECCTLYWRVSGVMTHREIALVANQHDGHIGVCMLASILQPAGQVIERLPPEGQGQNFTTLIMI